MKINSRLFSKSVLVAAVAALMTTSCADLWKEQHPGTYYTNNGETIADYLEGKLEDHGSFKYFKEILIQANLWGQMRTYGTYTCFAPVDSVIEAYVKQRYDDAKDPTEKARFADINTVLSDKALCDTIARTHLFDKAMFSSELSGDGVLEYPNMMDRFINYYSDSIKVQAYDIDGNALKAVDGSDSLVTRLRYLINMQSIITKADDTVQNGVVHKIDRVLRTSTKLIYGIIQEDPQLTIFYDALLNTHLLDTLDKYVIDLTYPGVTYDWTKQAAIEDAPDHHWHATSVEKHEREVMPEERKFMFTVFCVKDSVLKAYNDDYCAAAGLTNGIQDYSDLVKYAEAVYPEGAGLPQESRASSINKLISYHILPYFLTYEQFNTSASAIVKKYNAVYTKVGEKTPKYPVDVEDFFSTLLPHSIMRISTPWQGMDGTPTRRGGIFINRKGVEGVQETTLEFPGTRIAESGEYNVDKKGNANSNIAMNGIYHYVDGLLLYDDNIRENALSCRMRIMSCTLSPDFVNSGGRGRMRDSYDIVYCYYPDYCENFDWVEGQTGLYVRYRDANFGTLNGDELSVMYNYDISVKLPSVPSDGTYEVRVWNNAISGLGEGAADRGVVQFYFHEGSNADDSIYWRNWDWEPEGIPVDLRITGDDGRIGMVLDNDAAITNLPEKEQQAEIDANDRAMRNRGYMKAPDAWGGLRTDKNCYRKIVSRRYMRADNNYYLRMRQVYTSGTGVMPFSFVEIVPKDVYDGNEDKH